MLERGVGGRRRGERQREGLQGRPHGADQERPRLWPNDVVWNRARGVEEEVDVWEVEGEEEV